MSKKKAQKNEINEWTRTMNDYIENGRMIDSNRNSKDGQSTGWWPCFVPFSTRIQFGRQEKLLSDN